MTDSKPTESASAVLDLGAAVPSHKQVAAFFLLPACDIRCSFCISHNEFDVARPADAEGLMEALAQTSIDSVVLGGGEPTLWPHDLNALAASARRLGITTQLNTHGGGVLAKLDDYSEIDRFILPLESSDPAVHDNLRRGFDGHHKMVLELIDALVSAGRELTFATVVTSENHADIPKLAAWIGALCARGARVHAWHLYNFLPEGRGGAREIAAHLATTREQYLAACAAAKGAGLDFAVYRRDNMLKSSSVEFFWFEKGALHMGGGDLTGRALQGDQNW
ncbi:MAG: MoaA/NifB/PqqE/SkfB family radical SAM enzyme [Candidatus Paceibacteria bacterium]|jgi:MoaA/NifB/PqqE/SkfB family radical SAM enzyme